MKKLIKKLIFGSGAEHRILSGPSAGMRVKYDIHNRASHLLGLYEREIYSYLNKSMKKADTLIDIGANDGYYGLAFVKCKGKEVILCEPGPSIADLTANLALNGFYLQKHYTVIDRLVSGETIANKISINDIIRGKSSVFVLMDIDGGEQDVVDNIDFSLDVNMEWLIETHSKQLEDGIVKRFRENGYQVTIIPNSWWRLFIPEQRPLDHNRWLFATKRR